MSGSAFASHIVHILACIIYIQYMWRTKCYITRWQVRVKTFPCLLVKCLAISCTATKEPWLQTTDGVENIWVIVLYLSIIDPQSMQYNARRSLLLSYSQWLYTTRLQNRLACVLFTFQFKTWSNSSVEKKKLSKIMWIHHLKWPSHAVQCS